MSFGYKKVLVVGATSRIGKALSEKLVQNGIPTIIAGRRKDNLDEFIAKHGSDKVQAKVFDALKLDEVCLCPFDGLRRLILCGSLGGIRQQYSSGFGRSICVKGKAIEMSPRWKNGDLRTAD